MKLSRSLCACFKVAAIIGMLPLVGRGAQRNWNTGNGVFSNTSSWNPMAVPGNADDAIFNVGGATYTVTFQSGAVGFPQPVYTTDKVIVRSDAVTFARSIGGVGPAFVADSTTLDPTSERGIVLGPNSGDTGSLTTTISTTAVSATIADAYSSTSELHVTAHSTFTISTNSTSTDALFVGRHGFGTLTIDNGGQLSVTGNDSRISVGDDAAATGHIDVDGAGSKLSMAGPFFQIGNSGTGVVSITDGGEVDTYTADVGIENGSAGVVTVDGIGSTFHTVGFLSLGSGSSAQGQLVVKNGGLASIGGSLTVFSNASISGDSTISANSVVTDGIVSPGGIPSAPIAALHVTTSNFTQNASGHLLIQLGGTTRNSQYDTLQVNGAVHLGGTLDVSLANSFVPIEGESFDVLDGTSIDGTFAAINLPALSTGLMWNTSQLYRTGVLSVGLPGDYNLNGVVDAADFVVWRKTLGERGIGLAADGNNNNGVDSGDFDVWRAHFGQSAGNGAGASTNAAVPEPATWLLCATALVFVVAGSREAMRAAACSVVGVMFASALASSTRTADDTWKTAVSGNCETGASWTDGSTPGNADAATIAQNGTYTATFGATPAAIQQLSVNNGVNVTFQTGGGLVQTLRVNASGGSQTVSLSDSGTTLTLGTIPCS